LSSSSTTSAAALAYIRARAAHRDADVGDLERGGVIDAITGDGHDLALALQRLVRCASSARPTTRANRISRASSAICSCVSDIRRRLSPLTTVRRPALHQADLARDRQRRVRMVASDHDDADPRVGAARDRRGHLRTRRILESDQAAEHESRLVPRRPPCSATQTTMGEGEHPQSSVGHRLQRGQQPRAQGIV